MSLRPAHFLALAPLALAPSTAFADDPVAGFETESLANPVVTSDEVLALSDGDFLANTGAIVQLVFAAGPQKQKLAEFSPLGTAGALAVDPTERYVLAGESTFGSLLLIDRQTGSVEKIGELPGNVDAVFESPTSVLVSSTGCSGLCGNSLVRIDTVTREIKTLVDVDGGAAGALELEPDGDLLYASRDAATGSGAIHRFDAADLVVGAPVFHEQGGFLAVEIESMPAYDLWVEETEDDGFTGTSYYRWNGPNYFNTPGISPIDYDLVIENPGRYEFVIHNKHDFPESDKENDVWARMDNGPWIKVFSNGGPNNVGVWNWLSWFDYSGALPNEQAFYDLTAGPHRLQIAARSFNFKIDRFHLYKQGVPDVWDVDEPESSRGLELSDAAVVLGGLNGVRELERASDGSLYLADENAQGRGRILALGNGASAPSLLLETDVVEELDDLTFVEGGGPGVFAPFQPDGAGQLVYQTRQGTGLYGRAALASARPDLSLSGPALTGPGPLELTLSQAPVGSIGFPVAAPTTGGLGIESSVPGFPLLFTPFDLGSVLLLPGSLPVGPNGIGSISYPTSGLSGADLGLQVLVFSPALGDFLATSTVATL